MLELIRQFKEQLTEETWQLVQSEAKLIIGTDLETGEERLEIHADTALLERCYTDWLQKKIQEVVDIVRQIQQIPSEGLKEIAYTGALLDEWHKARQSNVWVAQFFMANCLFLDSDPLVSAATTKLGTDRYESLHARADLIRSLWELLDTGHPYIKKRLTEKGVHYPFQTSRDLLITILRAEEDNRFAAKACGYHNIDTPEWAALWNFVAQKSRNFTEEDLGELHRLGKKLVPGQAKPRYNLFPDKDPTQWFDVALWICHFESRFPRNSRLKRKLEAFYRDIPEFASDQRKCARARTAEGKVWKSKTWRNGEVTVAGKWGTRQ